MLSGKMASILSGLQWVNMNHVFMFRGLHLVFWQVVRGAISLADTKISLYIDI